MQEGAKMDSTTTGKPEASIRAVADNTFPLNVVKESWQFNVWLENCFQMGQ